MRINNSYLGGYHSDMIFIELFQQQVVCLESTTFYILYHEIAS